MKYTAVRQRKTASVVAGLLLLAALLCGSFGSLGFGLRAVWQLLMMICLVAVIQIGQKYLLSGYDYILDADEDLLRYNRLTIVRTVGKRRYSVFTLPLASLTQVIPYRKTKALIAEYGRPTTRMSFCADMLPRESYLLLFEVDHTLSVIRIQCDASFAEALRSRAGF